MSFSAWLRKLIPASPQHSACGRARHPKRAHSRLHVESLEDRIVLSFGVGGEVSTDFGADDAALAMALQPDGRIVAAGLSTNSRGASKLAVARYTPGGALDTTFSNDGKDARALGWTAQDVVVQSDGKIVVVGTQNNNFRLVRYNADGTLDGSFGSKGQVTTDLGGADWASAVVLQADGKIVVGGLRFGFDAFAVVRYNPNGTLDATFGSGGKVLTSVPNGIADNTVDVALQSDGRIVLAGSQQDGLLHSDFAVARYNPNGTLDASFAGGYVVINQSMFPGSAEGSFDFAEAVAIQADGKIVVAGTASLGDVTTSFLAMDRLNPDGTLDTGFGAGGTLVTSVPGWERPFYHVGLALQQDGKLLATATTPTATSFASTLSTLARFNPDGSPDATFAGVGTVTLPGIGRGGLAVQTDGNILVGGSNKIGSGSDFWLARYRPDGSLDGGGALLTAAAPRSRSTLDALTADQVQPLLAETLARWQAAGADTALLGWVATVDHLFAHSSDHWADAWLGASLNEQFESTHLRAMRRR